MFVISIIIVSAKSGLFVSLPLGTAYKYLKGICHGCLVHFADIKQLLDSFFVISGIIKVEVGVISRAEGRGG